MYNDVMGYIYRDLARRETRWLDPPEPSSDEIFRIHLREQISDLISLKHRIERQIEDYEDDLRMLEC